MNPTTKTPSGPKTLHQARELIEQLKARLGYLRSCDIAPPTRETLPAKPTKQETADDIRGFPDGSTSTASRPDLGSMTPRQLSEVFANSTSADLRVLLSTETSRDRKHQNPAVIASLYRELKARRSS